MKKIILIFTALLFAFASQAQDKISVKLYKEEATAKNLQPEKPDTCYYLYNSEREIVAYISPQELIPFSSYKTTHYTGCLYEKRTITFFDGIVFDIPPIPNVFVSADTSTIVVTGTDAHGFEFGKGINRGYDSSSVYFYNKNGKLQRTITDKHGHTNQYKMSNNGYFLIVATNQDNKKLGNSENKNKYITYYDPLGNELFNYNIGKNAGISNIAISPSSNFIAVSYTTFNEQKKRENYYVIVLDKEGNIITKIQNNNFTITPPINFLNDNYILSWTFEYGVSLYIINENKNSLVVNYNNIGIGFMEHNILFFEVLKFVVIKKDFLKEGTTEITIIDIETGKEQYINKIEAKPSFLTFNNKNIYKVDENKFKILTPEKTYYYEIEQN